jgi:DNA-binding PadR family transcriptional regulator
MARGEFISKILEILQIQAEATVDLLDIFTSSYAEAHRKARKTMKYGPRQFKTDWSFEYLQRQQFYSLLNQLKNQGLIEKKKENDKNGSIWKITKKGLEKLNLMKTKNLFSIRKANINFKKQPDDKIKVIIFDIPEKERHKRAWLRMVLISLGFSLLQQSVWIGKNKIPERFIFDLRERGMLDFVQIFEVSKKGTIKQLS